MFNRHVVDLLSGYLDGQLADKEREQVQEHLKECASCKQEEERLKLLSDSLKAWQAPEASVHFDQAVRDKIVLSELEKGAQKMDKKTFRIFIPSGVVAGLLVLMLFNAVTHKGIQGRMRSPEDQIGQQMTNHAAGSDRLQATRSYEPYYLSTTLCEESAAKKENAILAARAPRAADGFMYDGSSRSDLGAIPASYPVSTQEEAPGEGAVIIIQPSLPATGVGEKIIRSAVVRLEVEDGKDAYGKLTAVCRDAGGYMASSTLGKDEDGRTSGMLTMRIPRDKFEDALEKIRGFGQVRDFSTDSRDVSQEYKNLRTQLETSMILYNKIVQVLKEKKNTIPDIIRTESQLTPVQQRIDQLKNQIEALDNKVSFTTIRVGFFEPQVSDKILKQSGRYIHESFIGLSVDFVKSFARALPALLTLAVVLAIIFWIVAWVRGRIRETRKKD